VWWHTPAIPALKSVRQEEDCKFAANLSFIARPCLKNTKHMRDIVVPFVVCPFRKLIAWDRVVES
jgi:hypothetical protein